MQQRQIDQLRPMVQSTLPARGSDRLSLCPAGNYRSNPRSPRGGERRRDGGAIPEALTVSSHAPARGATGGHEGVDIAPTGFNPRSPRGGGDKRAGEALSRVRRFNPRSREGGATVFSPHKNRSAYRRFNPRSPRGGTLTDAEFDACVEGRLIHAPREGERPFCSRGFLPGQFQSTLPARGSDVMIQLVAVLGKKVSIHAPARGSDATYTAQCLSYVVSNPLPARGGADAALRVLYTDTLAFQSAPREGGATGRSVHRLGGVNVQSTLPARRRLAPSPVKIGGMAFFNPRPREGSDDRGQHRPPLYAGVSIHAPKAGSDAKG